MSNVDSERRVEGDWWKEPIPPNVIFGEGFYCESAQIFRHLKSKAPRAVVLGDHVSCYAGCSFALGVNGGPDVGCHAQSSMFGDYLIRLRPNNS